MVTYYLEVSVLEVDNTIVTFDDVMKNREMPLEAAKQIAGTIANTGFIKEHKSIIASSDGPWYEFYPPNRILSIKIKPEDIIVTGG